MGMYPRTKVELLMQEVGGGLRIELVAGGTMVVIDPKAAPPEKVTRKKP